jgi:hypothetical protein
VIGRQQKQEYLEILLEAKSREIVMAFSFPAVDSVTDFSGSSAVTFSSLQAVKSRPVALLA